MASYSLITETQLGAFTAAAQKAGFGASDFELQEAVFDPQTAEVEARKGDVGVRRLRTDAVAVYPLGDGSDWVAGFAADLASGGSAAGPGAECIRAHAQTESASGRARGRAQCSLRAGRDLRGEAGAGRPAGGDQPGQSGLAGAPGDALPVLAPVMPASMPGMATRRPG